MRKAILIIALLLLTGGVSVVFYPHAQQMLYRRYADNVIAAFEERVEYHRAESEGGSLHWLYQLMVEYNAVLYQSRQSDLIDSFAYSQLNFSLREFGFEEEMIGFITIPRMNVRLPIFLGANDPNMLRGAAHMTQTSLPVGGENHNTVIAAHRGMSTAAMFRDIELLQTGDEIIITNFYQSIVYEVVKTQVVMPTQVNAILIQSGRDLVTLVTCHPYRLNYQRYLVFAQRVN